MSHVEGAMSLHPQYDAIPDRSNDWYLFCPICPPETFFCPVGKPERLIAHYEQTGHDRISPHAVDALPVTPGAGVTVDDTVVRVKMYHCRLCKEPFRSLKHLLEHRLLSHAPISPAPIPVLSRVKTFLQNLP